MSARRLLTWVAVVIVVLGAGLLACARNPAIDPISPPLPEAFDPDLVERGRELAGFGDCEVCHTGRSGIPFAGGFAIVSPFGTIYTTNITPDPATGIGGWSEEAFRRAMHEGIGRDGKYLYPAFPYDHFTKVTDEDIAAIYAFIMSAVEPAEFTPPPHDLPFPFNIRMGLAAWNFLFLDDRRWEPDPNQDEEWNRGAYLVEGLGHCGSCHTPRNFMGAEVSDRAYEGGFAEGWYAPALDETSTHPVRWSQLALVNYLFDGFDENHGVSAGPMTPVVNHLYDRNEDDVFAMAAYVASLAGMPVPDDDEAREAASDRIDFAAAVEWDEENPPAPSDERLARGAVVFGDLCAGCHKAGADTVDLALTSTVNMPDPANIIRVVRDGVRPPRGAPTRTMPNFAISLTEQNLVDLMVFIRDRFTDAPMWEDVEGAVTEALDEQHL